jgi:LPXTG-motif cell wall-anchored protein
MVSATGTAWAGVITISINSQQVPTKAANFGTQSCDQTFGGGPFTDKDVWVFVLPGNQGDFVSITAVFNNGQGNIDVLISRQSDSGNFAALGTPKAFMIEPAGWTLESATAVVTDDAKSTSFNLTHTCPAVPTPTPTPTKTTPHPPTSTSTSPSHGGSSSSSQPGGSTSSASGSNGNASPSLPVTGVALSGIIITGLALVGGGGVLLYIRRRMDRSMRAGRS